MKKKTVIILSSAVAICALGLVSSHFIDWPVSHDDASGDIAKSTRFSREQASEKLTNMEELLQTDSAFKDGIVAAQVIMQTRAVQFDSLVDMSNEVAGKIPAFAEVLKDMNATREMVENVTNSLIESGQNLDAALGGEECADLEQTTINASLAYTNVVGSAQRVSSQQVLPNQVNEVIKSTAAAGNRAELKIIAGGGY